MDKLVKKTVKFEAESRKPATGALQFTVRLAQIVSAAQLLKAIRQTVYVPDMIYVWVGNCAVLVFPSPKSQSQPVIPPGEFVVLES